MTCNLLTELDDIMPTGKSTSLFDMGGAFSNAVDAITGIGDRAEGVNNHDGRQIAVVYLAGGIALGGMLQRNALEKLNVSKELLTKSTMMGGLFPKAF